MAGLEGTTFAGFEILEKLGQGGMGAVYKARQAMLDRVVALKVMAGNLAQEEDYVRRFQREARAAAAIDHPNAVKVYAFGEEAGIHYIAMEYVEGETLRKRIERLGRLDPEEALLIAEQVAAALGHAWEWAQLIHRDIKPHLPDPGWRGEGGRPRPGQVAQLGEHGTDRHRRDDGFAALHEPGTGARGERRGFPRRHVQPGLHALSHAHREHALRSRRGVRAGRHARELSAPGDFQGVARVPVAAGDVHGADAEQEEGAAAWELSRADQRAGNAPVGKQARRRRHRSRIGSRGRGQMLRSSTRSA